MHSLCIDSRAARELPASGLLAEELVTQLAASGELPPDVRHWREKEGVALVTHPRQPSPDLFPRYASSRRAAAPWSRWWEQRLLRDRSLELYHCFRTLSDLPRGRLCPELVTLLPSRSLLPSGVQPHSRLFLAVPSAKDRELLEQQYGIERDHIHVLGPVIRSHFAAVPSGRGAVEGGALILLGSRRVLPKQERILELLKRRFPTMREIRIHLHGNSDLGAETYDRILSRTRVCFYLSADPFDWGTLFLEALYRGIPSLFWDEHRALGELMPESPLRIRHYLLENISLEELRDQSREARGRLEQQGVFEPYRLSCQYAELYRRLARPAPDRH